MLFGEVMCIGRYFINMVDEIGGRLMDCFLDGEMIIRVMMVKVELKEVGCLVLFY